MHVIIDRQEYKNTSSLLSLGTIIVFKHGKCFAGLVALAGIRFSEGWVFAVIISPYLTLTHTHVETCCLGLSTTPSVLKMTWARRCFWSISAPTSLHLGSPSYELWFPRTSLVCMHANKVYAADCEWAVILFSDYYAQRKEYKLLESCILQLNPKCLDIHQVWDTCSVTVTK